LLTTVLATSRAYSTTPHRSIALLAVYLSGYHNYLNLEEMEASTSLAAANNRKNARTLSLSESSSDDDDNDNDESRPPAKKKHHHASSSSSDCPEEKEKCTLCHEWKNQDCFITKFGGADSCLKGMCYPCTGKLYGQKMTLWTCERCERSVLPNNNNNFGRRQVVDQVWSRLLQRPLNNIHPSYLGCPFCRAAARRANGFHAGDGQARLGLLVDTENEDEEQGQKQRRKCGNCHQQKSWEEFSPTQWSMMIAVDTIRGEAQRHRGGPLTVGQLQAQAFYSYSYSFYQGQCLECLPPSQEWERGVEENWKRDRAVVQALYRRFKMGIYDAPTFRSLDFQMVPPPLDLVGTYDILYVKAETQGDRDKGDILCQRAAITPAHTTIGTVELSVSDSALNRGEVPSLLRNDGNDVAVGDSDAVDYEDLRGKVTLTNTDGFGRCFGSSGMSLSFLHHRIEGSVKLVGECMVGESWVAHENLRLSVVSRKKVLPWIPCDDVSPSSPYGQQMQEEVRRRYKNPTPHLLWLSNHKGLPESVSHVVLDFMGPLRPSPTFALQRGDVWLSVQMEYFGYGCNMNLLARPR